MPPFYSYFSYRGNLRTLDPPSDLLPSFRNDHVCWSFIAFAYNELCSHEVYAGSGAYTSIKLTVLNFITVT
jgi:hypothetical protein